MNSLTDKEINRASDGIDKALSTATRSNRGEVAFRILSVVRNLNDHIAFKIWKDVRPDQKMDINKVASKFGNVRPYQFMVRQKTSIIPVLLHWLIVSVKPPESSQQQEKMALHNGGRSFTLGVMQTKARMAALFGN